MFSKQKILAAIIGLTMMALPATALAGHHDNDRDGRQAWQYRHDNGKHKGWWKHGHDWGNRPAWNNNPWNYHHEPDADDYHPVWNYHHEPDADDYRPAWTYHHEPDADDYRPAWNYRHQSDDDDDQGYSGSGYYTMPNGLNAAQQIQYLMQRRANTYTLYHRARVRHDVNAQRRLSASIHNLDARIKYLRRTNGYAAPYAYNPGYAPSSFGGNPYYAGNPYMGYPYPSNSPTVNTLGALVGPMLGLPY